MCYTTEIQGVLRAALTPPLKGTYSQNGVVVVFLANLNLTTQGFRNLILS